MTRPASKRTRRSGTVRCVIYIRKSSRKGLEQEFNSLQAQREVCEAFIKSQQHESWVCLPDDYGDGGLSGATMDRPAMQQLFAEIQAERVEIVVVYKVGRQIRSLADFAKIVEIVDAKGASFVSVAQKFNMTISMGRLTLNVLLSFARFEREVTGERIRDRIAAGCGFADTRRTWVGPVVEGGARTPRCQKQVVDERVGSPLGGKPPAVGMGQDDRPRAAQIGATAGCAAARFAGNEIPGYSRGAGNFSIVPHKCRSGRENGEANQALDAKFP